MATMTMSLCPTTPTSSARYIVSPIADALFIIGAPLFALGVTCVVALALGRPARGIDGTWVSIALGTLIGAHVVMTLVHTHGNESIFRRHPWRFTLVPALVLVALASSPSLRIAALVVAVPWDIHHGSMQTFGLSRLYARRAGNVDGAGRTLELLLNHVIYTAPLLAGAGLAIEASAVGAAWSAAIPGLTRMATTLAPALPALRAATVAIGAGVVAAYAWQQRSLARRGVPTSPQAALLLGATALTSIVSWGLNPFAMALLTMRLFHCVQYFAIVAHAERPQVAGWLGREARSVKVGLVAAILLLPALAYGLWARLTFVAGRNAIAMSVVLTLTLMHYWYDGFTWSARRGSW